jgi:hypothetical protein
MILLSREFHLTLKIKYKQMKSKEILQFQKYSLLLCYKNTFYET